MTSKTTYWRHQFENNLQTVLLIAAMMVVLAVLGYTLGGLWWLLIFVIFCAITMAMMPKIGPALLFRFYKAQVISPSTNPGLYRLLVELSRRAELPRPPALYYIPTDLHNAFAIGSGKSASVAISHALLRDFSTRELAGVLAHEIAHIANRDTTVMGLADAISRFATMLSRLGIFLTFLNLPLIMMGIQQVSWLPVLIMIFSPTIAALLQLGLSRTREFAADADAARLTGDPDGLAMALAKLEKIHGSAWEDVFLSGRRRKEPSLLRTHPPTEERIKRLMDLKEKQLPEKPAPLRHPAPNIANARELLRSLFEEKPEPSRPRWHMFGNWY